MRRYETIFIADPDLSDEGRDQLFERTKDLIKKQNGFLVEFDEWGSRKLAYDIKKKNRGYYIRLDFCSEAALVEEMERNFRIDDRVLKFMTILLDNEADLENIKEELAAAEAEKEAKEAKNNGTSNENENGDDSPEPENEESNSPETKIEKEE